MNKTVTLTFSEIIDLCSVLNAEVKQLDEEIRRMEEHMKTDSEEVKGLRIQLIQHTQKEKERLQKLLDKLREL